MADPANAVEIEIARLEEREAKAMLAGDCATLNELWSVDLIVNSTANIIAGRDTLIAWIASRRLRFNTYERVITRLSCSAELGIATGNETTEAAIGRPEVRTFCSYMNVWRKEGGSWKLIARHVGMINSQIRSAGGADLQ
jgi:hypothetical protein